VTAATIGYQPPAAGRRPGTGTWHAVVTATVKVGWVTREAGEALCGLVPLADPPPVLFLAVTCRACLANRRP